MPNKIGKSDRKSFADKIRDSLSNNIRPKSGRDNTGVANFKKGNPANRQADDAKSGSNISETSQINMERNNVNELLEKFTSSIIRARGTADDDLIEQLKNDEVLKSNINNKVFEKTPLYYAADAGDENMVRALLEVGANPRGVNIKAMAANIQTIFNDVQRQKLPGIVTQGAADEMQLPISQNAASSSSILEQNSLNTGKESGNLESIQVQKPQQNFLGADAEIDKMPQELLNMEIGSGGSKSTKRENAEDPITQDTLSNFSTLRQNNSNTSAQFDEILSKLSDMEIGSGSLKSNGRNSVPSAAAAGTLDTSKQPLFQNASSSILEQGNNVTASGRPELIRLNRAPDIATQVTPNIRPQPIPLEQAYQTEIRPHAIASGEAPKRQQAEISEVKMPTPQKASIIQDMPQPTPSPQQYFTTSPAARPQNYSETRMMPKPQNASLEATIPKQNISDASVGSEALGSIETQKLQELSRKVNSELSNGSGIKIASHRTTSNIKQESPAPIAEKLTQKQSKAGVQDNHIIKEGKKDISSKAPTQEAPTEKSAQERTSKVMNTAKKIVSNISNVARSASQRLSGNSSLPPANDRTRNGNGRGGGGGRG